MHPLAALRQRESAPAGSRSSVGLKRREPGSIAEATARAIHEVGGVRSAMAVLGLSQTRVYALTDPDERRRINAEGIEALCVAGATALAEHFALLAGGLFLPSGRDEGDSGLHRLTGAAAAEFGDFVRVQLAALADGRLTPAEAAEALRELEEALAPLTRLWGELYARAGEGR